MRTYVNETIYNALSEELKETIKDTYVVSGHGSAGGEINNTATDKIYLLSTKEVWGTELNDTAGAETRQLDYYANIGVTTSNNYSVAKKKYNGSVSDWSLRSTDSNRSEFLYCVNNKGNYFFAVLIILTGQLWLSEYNIYQKHSVNELRTRVRKIRKLKKRRILKSVIKQR